MSRAFSSSLSSPTPFSSFTTIMEVQPKKQTSRKGKKAWRKNIVVDDINAALDAKREKQVLLGDDTETDFVIDDLGSRSAASTTRVLRTAEILANKSKVPALSVKSKKSRVGKARANKLMALAGRSLTESKSRARQDAEGFVRGTNTDIWADVSDRKPSATSPTSISYTPATNAPGTLKHKPLHLHSNTPQDNFVHAGKSYNPSIEAWKDLIDREYTTENEIQKKEQQIEDEKAHIQHLIETLSDNELDDDLMESHTLDEAESEEISNGEDGAGEDKYRLSVNEPTERKKKTKARRNREARHKKRQELEHSLKQLKKQLRDLSQLSKIESEVEGKLANTKSASTKKYKRHGKHDVIFRPVEVKLSDELTSNLRGVRPEGSPYYEQMHKLQMSGKIEARVPVSQKRRYAQKFTEKWSYKDFK